MSAPISLPDMSNEDPIVISGISVRLPESSNIEEFGLNLYNGVDLITEDSRRGPPGLYGLPRRNGKLKELDKFDAPFFGVHAKQAHVMDPQIRIMLELTHESIIDAGYNPETLRGTRTGVFVGVSIADSEEAWTRDPDAINGYALIGCTRSMFANRISYAFDFSGPSFALDAACASGLLGIEQAVSSIRSGRCDGAVVGGCSLLLKQKSSLHPHRLGMLSLDGRCKTFDSSADGYARSEAIVVILIQKASVARRAYAQILHAKTNVGGYKDHGITFAAGDVQRKLFKEVYDEAGINPATVHYVEAHGTGTKVGDPQELNAIADIFCTHDRPLNKALLVGAVKSNMGHSEAASGLCNIAKVIWALQNGIIPKNLNFKNPNPAIPALIDGKIKVISENTPFCFDKNTIIGVNSFGFGGANVHVILKPYPQHNLLDRISTTKIPIIIPLSGRTEEGVESVLKRISSNSTNPEFVALVHKICEDDVPGHRVRGYTIANLQTEHQEDNIEAGLLSSSTKPEIWYIFSGMGSQWKGMGKQMMHFDAFAHSIKGISEILKEVHGFELMELLFGESGESFDNVLNSFVAITAIQIALIDLLSSLDLPNTTGLIGHSIGELACAYADGCFTTRQTILAAYARGRAIIDARLPPGAMASIGLSWAEAQARCPPGIFVACHNAKDNVSVSGSPELIQDFIAKLKTEGIFASAIHSSGQAFHSEYIKGAGALLAKELDKLIPAPKPRTPRWISTSTTGADNEKLRMLSSSEYHVHNLLSPVLFQEALEKIPSNALVIEISPHAIFQSILKRSLPPTVRIISLNNKNSSDNRVYFLSALGKLWLAGINPKFVNLYPKVTFPVPLGTPWLSAHVTWDHSASWDVARFGPEEDKAGTQLVEISLASDMDSFLAGHQINGKILFPASGHIYNAWKIWSKLHGRSFDETGIVFENLMFHRATLLSESPAKTTKFHIAILESSGEFEVTEKDGSLVVSGRIGEFQANAQAEEFISKKIPDMCIPLTSTEVYRTLRLRGYEYSGVFRGIHEADVPGNTLKLKWEKNWISFLDSMLQTLILTHDYPGLYLPVGLEKVVIDPKKFLDASASGIITAKIKQNFGTVRCPGIQITGLKTSLVRRQGHGQGLSPISEEYKFTPYFDQKDSKCGEFLSARDALRTMVSIIMENAGAAKLRVVEIVEKLKDALAHKVHLIIKGEPLIQDHITIFTKENTNAGNFEPAINIIVSKEFESLQNFDSPHVIILHNSEPELISSSQKEMKENTFLLLQGQIEASRINLKLISHKICWDAKERLEFFLYRKLYETPTQIQSIEVNHESYNWIEKVQEVMNSAAASSIPDTPKLYLVSNATSGLLGLINCLKLEPGGHALRVILSQDPTIQFNFANPNAVLQQILEADLITNVINDLGRWGTFCHFMLESENTNILPLEYAFLNNTKHGDFSSLKWIEHGKLKLMENSEKASNTLCAVAFAAINNRDFGLGTGKISPNSLSPANHKNLESLLGIEYSGTINREHQNHRIMGLVSGGALATKVKSDPVLTWEIPTAWSLDDGATVPLAYSTAYYALIIHGRLRHSERVLIHADGGRNWEITIASIRVALSKSSQVFVSIEKDDHKASLHEIFYEYLNIVTFIDKDELLDQKADLILNVGAQGRQIFRNLALNGRYLIMEPDNHLALSPSAGQSIHYVQLDALENIEDKTTIYKLVVDGIESGIVQPFPRRLYSYDQFNQAFTAVQQQRKQKILLKIPSETKVKAQRRTYFHPEKVFIILGGLGGFGLELAEWMADRGARGLVLVSRSGITNGYQENKICKLKGKGTRISAPFHIDTSTRDGASELISFVQSTVGPIGGIFNCAMVLKDGFFKNQTAENFQLVGKSKIDTTIAWDKETRARCSELDYFVCFSSVSCGRGWPGQSNYGWANSIMERICEQRVRDGFPGLAIQWGAIGDVGIVADATVVNNTIPQKIDSCLDTLDGFLQLGNHSCGSGAARTLASTIVAPPGYFGARSKLFNNGAGKSSMYEAVAGILGMKINSISKGNAVLNLAELGMDSLMGIEIKQALERDFEVVLSLQEIHQLNFNKLAQMDHDNEKKK